MKKLNTEAKQLELPSLVSDNKMTKKRTQVFGDGENLAALLRGDSASQLKRLPKDTFNVAVTSPPYFWVRDYGFDEQIGHEESVEEYIKSLINVFEEVKRVLHPEGVFYLNVGDTFYSGNGQPHGSDPRCSSRSFMRKKMRPVDKSGWDIPKKSLIGIPWKIAFAMQESGWTLRSSIIWNRCNSFVEPTARDRPHRQYEPIFMFSKSRFYSYDRSSLPEQDVWNIPIERTKRISHNASFPSELVKRCIETASPKGGHVLDPFVGSGTTIDVALELERNVVGIDMSPTYTSEVGERLSHRGLRRDTWKNMEAKLSMESDRFEKWPGNRKNFRKPGTPKVKKSKISLA